MGQASHIERDTSSRGNAAVSYQFLLGRAIEVKGQTYVVIALGALDDEPVVRATARIDGEQVTRVFPASAALRALVVDEEIEIRGVSFA
jgi:hypothetical protein